MFLEMKIPSVVDGDIVDVDQLLWLQCSPLTVNSKETGNLSAVTKKTSERQIQSPSFTVPLMVSECET